MIYKYLTHRPFQAPRDSKPLKLALVNGDVFIWLLMGTEPNATFKVTYVGTGWEDQPAGTYIDTLIEENGFVWHYFLQVT